MKPMTNTIVPWYNTITEQIRRKEMETKYAASMSIARALKEKNRVAARLGVIRNRISSENSMESNIKRTFDINKLIDDEKSLYTQLNAIKTAIAKANIEIADKLIEMSELRSKIDWLRTVPTREGTFQESVRYGESPITRTYTAILTGIDIIRETEAMQARIDAIQDEIDEFNATKHIDIPVINTAG